MSKKQIIVILGCGIFIGLLLASIVIKFEEKLPSLFTYYIPYPILLILNKISPCSEMGCALLAMFGMWLSYMLLSVLGSIIFILWKIKQK